MVERKNYYEGYDPHLIAFIRSKSSDYRNEMVVERLADRFIAFVEAVRHENPELGREQVFNQAYLNIGKSGFRKWYTSLFDHIQKKLYKDYWAVFKQTAMSIDIILSFLIAAIFYIISYAVYKYSGWNIRNIGIFFYGLIILLLIMELIIRYRQIRYMKVNHGLDSIPYFLISRVIFFSPPVKIIVFLPMLNGVFWGG